MKHGAHRSELGPDALALVAARFRVLAEPIRLAILQRLGQGEVTVGQLAEELGTSQPNVSKHLKLLTEAGFVARRQEKNTVYCGLADESVFELCDLVCRRAAARYAAQADALAPPARARRRRRA